MNLLAVHYQSRIVQTKGNGMSRKPCVGSIITKHYLHRCFGKQLSSCCFVFNSTHATISTRIVINERKFQRSWLRFFFHPHSHKALRNVDRLQNIVVQHQMCAKNIRKLLPRAFRFKFACYSRFSSLTVSIAFFFVPTKLLPNCEIFKLLILSVIEREELGLFLK